jgi:ribosomal protein L40E
MPDEVVMNFDRPMWDYTLIEQLKSKVRSFESNVKNISNITEIEYLPIEAKGGFVLYENTKEIDYIHFQRILSVKLVQTGSTFKKKKTLEIKFADDENIEKFFRFEIDDKEIQKISEDVNRILTNLPKLLKAYTLEYFWDGEKRNVPLPGIPYLMENEEILWKQEQTSGILNKKITYGEVVTNFRIFMYDFRSHDSGMVAMNVIDDAIVSNSHRESQSTRIGTFIGGGQLGKQFGFGGISPSYGTGESHTVGDVVILFNGQPVHKFSQISDPQGLARLIKSVKKELYDKLTKTKSQELICNKCNSSNPKKSKFCNSCGTALVEICSKCTKSSPADTNFCNHCGNKFE